MPDDDNNEASDSEDVDTSTDILERTVAKHIATPEISTLNMPLGDPGQLAWGRTAIREVAKATTCWKGHVTRRR